MTQKLELLEETQKQVIQACWQSEAKQLEIVLLRWREKHGNAADPGELKKSLEGLKPEGKLLLQTVEVISFFSLEYISLLAVCSLTVNHDLILLAKV